MMRATCLVLALLLLLPACGTKGPFRDRGNDYLKASPGQPLVYPEGMAPLAARDAWPVPDPERRRQLVPGEKPPGRSGKEIPTPPRLVPDDEPGTATGSGAGQPVPEARVLLTEDGNGHAVLMLDLDFDWAWQGVGDALRKIPDVKVEDLDRDQAVYFLLLDGKRTRSGEPYLLKLNYTANGIQVALQVDADAMAARELAAPLMEKLKAGMLK